MDPEAVRAVFDRSLALWNDGDLAVADEVYAPGCLVNGQPDSPAAVKRDVLALFAAFPDLRFTVESAIVEHDRIAVNLLWSGTHRGSFPFGPEPIPPTGKRFAVRGIEVFRVEGGKFVEIWTCWDWRSLQAQLGVSLGKETGAP